MQDEVKYTDEDYDKAVYLIDKGFVKRNYEDKSQDIREAAQNICIVRMRGYDEYIKNGGKSEFEGKT
jgi:hypothetical protein